MKFRERIKYRELRYVVPLMLLPFSAIIVAGTKGKEVPEGNKMTDIKAEMNTELQAPDLAQTKTMNKFDALNSAYEKKEDFSGIKGIEDGGEGGNLELDNKDLYSTSEMNRIDLLNGEGHLLNQKDKGETNFEVYKEGMGVSSVSQPTALRASREGMGKAGPSDT